MDYLPFEKAKRAVMNELPVHWEDKIEDVYCDLDSRIEELLDKNHTLHCSKQALEEMILARLGTEEGNLLIAKARSIEEEY